MEFRLVYSGRVHASSNSNTHVSNKHAMRREFHPQLRQLWAKKRNLHEMAVRLGDIENYNVSMVPFVPIEKRINPHSPEWNDQTYVETQFNRGIGKIAKQWERNGYSFIPLVTNQYCLRCSLDILFLRREEPGAIFQSGDIDGRLKTVFDALQMPKNLTDTANQGPQDDESPFYVLLEDDKLVSEIKVTTDQLLLLPGERNPHPTDAMLVINVKLQVAQPTEYAWAFS